MTKMCYAFASGMKIETSIERVTLPVFETFHL